MMFALGQWYLEWAIRRDVARGERWEERGSSPHIPRDESGSTSPPSLFLALAPLIVTLAMLNVIPMTCHALASPAATIGLPGVIARFLAAFPEDATLSIFGGVLIALMLPRRTQPLGAAQTTSATGVVSFRHGWDHVGEGFLNGLVAIGSTASVVGFGWAVQKLPAFQAIVDWVTHLPGDPLIGAALAVAVIAAIAGSASGGQGIALKIIKPIYIDELGVAPRALHRVVSIASGSLDSLPHNGYLVMLIRNICGETHARAYGPICVTTVLLPALGTVAAITLFKLVPAWASM
jgi:H+/gluconate symporter-like permease